MNFHSLLYLFFVPLLTCQTHSASKNKTSTSQQSTEIFAVGANQIPQYIDRLVDKNVAVVVNQTSTVGSVHLVDTLQELGIAIQTIFAPEHGFRGEADAGAQVNDDIDAQSGIPIVSIYGASKKPSSDQLKDIDIVLFDIQDVGARFYTYLSTMHYIMEACAENNVQVVILDRPNPNGHYVDGPVLDTTFRSFVGLHPIPIVHGMTLGELALMINGEGWLANQIKCDVSIIKCASYNRNMIYDLPIKPSPNLPNLKSILLYPSLCLFEGTDVSVGRGTTQQFQVIGHPDYTPQSHAFTPVNRLGARHPKHKNQVCYGESFGDVSESTIRKWGIINLDYLIKYYNKLDSNSFFNKNLFFDKLAGSDQLRLQILAGLSADQIRLSWQEGLNEFKIKRAPYLLYPTN